MNSHLAELLAARLRKAYPYMTEATLQEHVERILGIFKDKSWIGDTMPWSDRAYLYQLQNDGIVQSASLDYPILVFYDITEPSIEAYISRHKNWSVHLWYIDYESLPLRIKPGCPKRKASEDDEDDMPDYSDDEESLNNSEN